MCPASCQADIEDLIAACDECALTDAVCDATVDTDLYPSLAGDLSFEYRAPVVMAGGDMDDDCYEYPRRERGRGRPRGPARGRHAVPRPGRAGLRLLGRGRRKQRRHGHDRLQKAVPRTGRRPASSSPWRSTSRASSRTRAARAASTPAASLAALGGAYGTRPRRTKYSDLDGDDVPDDMKSCGCPGATAGSST